MWFYLVATVCIYQRRQSSPVFTFFIDWYWLLLIHILIYIFNIDSRLDPDDRCVCVCCESITFCSISILWEDADGSLTFVWRLSSACTSGPSSHHHRYNAHHTHHSIRFFVVVNVWLCVFLMCNREMGAHICVLFATIKTMIIENLILPIPYRMARDYINIQFYSIICAVFHTLL